MEAVQITQGNNLQIDSRLPSGKEEREKGMSIRPLWEGVTWTVDVKKGPCLLWGHLRIQKVPLLHPEPAHLAGLSPSLGHLAVTAANALAHAGHSSEHFTYSVRLFQPTIIPT